MMLWLAVVMIQLIATAFLAVALWIITPLDAFWSMMSGMALWTVILFWTKLIDSFIVSIKPYFGAVGTNRLKSYKKPVTDEDRLTLGPEDSLEEIGPGIWPSMPWWSWETIDLRKQVTVRRKVKSFTSDKIEVTIEYMMVIQALRGFLCNLVRNEDDEAQDVLEATVDSNIIHKVNTLTVDELIEEFDTFGDWFKMSLSGDLVSTNLEQQLGLSTSDLTAVGVERSASYQQAAEALVRAKMETAAAKEYRTLGSDPAKQMTDQQALEAVQANSGAIDLVVVRGFEKMTTGFIPQGLIPDRKGKKDKKDK